MSEHEGLQDELQPTNFTCIGDLMNINYQVMHGKTVINMSSEIEQARRVAKRLEDAYRESEHE